MKADFYTRVETLISAKKWKLGPVGIRRVRIFIPGSTTDCLTQWWLELPFDICIGLKLPARWVKTWDKDQLPPGEHQDIDNWRTEER